MRAPCSISMRRSSRAPRRITAKPQVAAIRGIDLDALRRSEVGIEAKLSSEQGSALLALLGLDRAIAAGDGPAQFEGSVSGAWRAPLRLKARLWGAGLDADARGLGRAVGAPKAKASVNLRIRSADISRRCSISSRPTRWRRIIRLSSRVALSGKPADLRRSRQHHRRLAVARPCRADARRGEVYRGRGRARSARPLRRPLPLAIGAAGHDATEPLGAGLVKGWRGRTRVSGVARRAAGRRRTAAGERHRQGRRPVADLRCDQGQDRRRRSDGDHRCAGRAPMALC